MTENFVTLKSLFTLSNCETLPLHALPIEAAEGLHSVGALAQEQVTLSISGESCHFSSLFSPERPLIHCKNSVFQDDLPELNNYELSKGAMPSSKKNIKYALTLCGPITLMFP